MKIILFLGYSGSGKTTALTSLLRLIVRKRLGTVGTLKHIHEPGFTIDTEGKDTWQYAASGAQVLVAVSPNELAIIKKNAKGFRAEGMSLRELLGIFRREKVDYLLVEGLHKKFKARKDIFRIICASTEREASELILWHRSKASKIICITGKLAEDSRRDGTGKRKEFEGIPLVSVPRETQKILQLIER